MPQTFCPSGCLIKEWVSGLALSWHSIRKSNPWTTSTRIVHNLKGLSIVIGIQDLKCNLEWLDMPYAYLEQPAVLSW